MNKKTSISKMIISYLFFVSFVPVTIIGLFIFFYLSKSIKDNIASRHRSLISSISREVKTYIEIPLFLINHIKYHIENEQLGSDNELNNLLNIIQKDYDIIEMIQVINNEGRITNVAPFNQDIIDFDLTGQDFYKLFHGSNEIKWSNPFISIYSGYSTLALSLPYSDGYILEYINLEELNRIISEIKIDKTGFAFITDNIGYLVTYPDYNRVIRRDSLRQLKFIQDGINGIYGLYIYKDKNRKYITSTEIIKRTGWIICVIQEYDEVYKIMNTIQIAYSLLVLLITFLMLYYLLVIRKSINQPIGNLINNSKEIADGHYSLVIPDSSIKEIDMLSQNYKIMAEAIKKREKTLRDSIKEKVVLLQEVHHRVKNNLLFLYSIFNLQQEQVKDEKIKSLLEDAKNRIKSIGLIHTMIYKSDNMAEVNFSEFIKTFCNELSQIFLSRSREILMIYKLDIVYLNIKQLIPCGIIINELVTNIFKHAFENKKTGEITIELNKKSGKIYLIVSDNGRGLRNHFDIKKAKSLGLSLVSMFSKQLNANLSIESSKYGTVFKITF